VSARRISVPGPPIKFDPAEVARQFAHEHARAYDAVHAAANRLELAGPGHEREVALLRAICRRISRHEAAGSCDGD
jgi:hypothetical protein